MISSLACLVIFLPGLSRISSECCAETTTVSTRTGLPPSILDRDLRFAVGAKIWQYLFLPDFGQPLGQFVRQHDRHRHQFWGLTAGITGHQALVAGAADINSLRDIRRLRTDGIQNRAGII